jgi:aminocarboxymuconate-semialdehyde decarboxylase
MMRDGVFFREIEVNCWDPEVRLAECDVSGIEIQVLSTVPVMFSYWAKPEDGAIVARALNDDLASTVAAHPSRFVGLGTLPMQDPDLAIAELERCLKIGLTGIEIGTHINDWNINDPEVFVVLEAASNLGAPVFVHPWDMMGMDRMPKYWLPWLVGMPAETSLAISSAIFGGIFDRLPKLRMAFAHGGGSFPGTIGRIQHGYEVRPDLCAIDNEHEPRHYMGQFWTDSLTHDSDALRSLVSLIGANRVALGTDYPFPLGESTPGSLIEATYPQDAPERDSLFRAAAEEWLGIFTQDRQG